MECEVCLEVFDQTDHQPYCLMPCLHSFCFKCLSKLASKSCPICCKKIENKCLNFTLYEMINEPFYKKELEVMNNNNNNKTKWNICKQCMKPFDHSKNKPFSFMPCLHTLCKYCATTHKKTFCPQCSQKISDKTTNWSLLHFIPESKYDQIKKELEISLNDVHETVNLIKNKKRQRKYKRKFEMKFQKTKKHLNENRLNESEMDSLKKEFELLKIEIETKPIISKSRKKMNSFFRLFCLAYFNLL